MNKQTALLQTLKTGVNLTAAQIKEQFGSKNPHAMVSNLRDQGHCIYGNRSAKSGVITYRLGNASKRIVSLASKMFGAEVFSNR